MKILEVKGLSKTFHGRGRRSLAAVDGVSFDILAGESLGLVGESGCGKSSLARCILRLLEPESGSVIFLERDWLALRGRALRQARREMQAIFQDPFQSLNPRMTVGQIIEEPLKIHSIGTAGERRERIERLMSRVGLEAQHKDRLPAAMSGGQRQRVAIARALAPSPKLLIADEPVSALDVSLQQQIIALLKHLKEQLHLTTLFVSHSLPVVRQFCTRVAVMHRGRLVELAGAEELFEDARHPYTRSLLASVPSPNPAAPFKPEIEALPPARPGDLSEVEPGHWVSL